MATSIHAVAPSVLTPVQQLDQKIRSAIRAYNQSFAHLAYFGWRLKLANGFEELGFEDERAYMISLGVRKSWWYSAVAIGQLLQTMALEEIEKIQVGQLLLLLDVEPEIRSQYPWAQEAATDGFTELARKINDRNVLVPGSRRVPTATMTVRVPAMARDAILTGLNEFKERHDLRSPGQALEFLVADTFDRPNVTGALYEGLRLLEGVQKSLDSYPGLGEEKIWLSLARDRIEGAYKELLEGSDAVHEEKVRARKEARSDKDN